jgi:uncharacterized repeat protein (TIGR01451 family)
VDSVPANTQFIGADNNGQAAGGVVRWDIPALAPGGFNSVSFQVRINQGVAAGTVISNQAQIGGPTVPQPVQSNTVNTTVTPPQQVNLTLLKEVNKPQAPPNDTLTYTLSYANNGAQTFNQLVLVDTLPAGTNFESATDGGQLVGRDVRWNLPSLPPGTNGRVRFTLRIANGYPIGQVISNVARITGPGLPGEIQSNTANTTVGPVLPTQLTVTKQVNTPQAAPGAELTYSITYVNTGQQTANGLELEDPLPANTQFLGADSGGQLDGNTVRWNLPPATPGNGGSVGFRVRVNDGVPAGTVINNRAQIVGPTVPQPVESNVATTTIAGGQPGPSFAGTWFAKPPTDHAAALTVDRQNRFTVWAVSRDQVLITHSAQGHLNPDGSFDVVSPDGRVHFTGQVAQNGQSAQITAERANVGSFTVTAPRAPDVGPLPDLLTGTWNGVGQASNGDRLEVHLSIDPQGNSTFYGAVTQAGGTIRRQFANFYITPDGRITDPNGNRQVGTLQQQGNQLVLTYSFQHAGPPAYQRDFQVVLQPLP